MQELREWIWSESRREAIWMSGQQCSFLNEFNKSPPCDQVLVSMLNLGPASPSSRILMQDAATYNLKDLTQTFWRNDNEFCGKESVVLEKTLKSPLDSNKIKPVHPKGNQPWTFIGRTDAEAEAPILWPSDAKNWLIGKDSDAGKDWRQEKGMTEDEMVGWHHRLNAHEFEQTPGDGEGQRSLACCSPWGPK